MNIEAFEKDEKYCSVRETNGKVRVLEKKKKDNTFKDILDLENKIEDVETTIELISYNIQNIVRKNNDKRYIYLIEFISILALSFLFKITTVPKIIMLTTFLEMVNIAITGLLPYNNKRLSQLREEVKSFIDESVELKLCLSQMKAKNSVEEFVAIDSEVPDKDVNCILAPAFHNRPVGNLYNLYSMKVLKYELLRYMARENGYSINEDNIHEVEVEYPGIPRILKKKRD